MNLAVNRIVPCPDCHRVCAWCSWYAKNARDAGCGRMWKKTPKCEWGESLKGQKPCPTCGGSETMRLVGTLEKVGTRASVGKSVNGVEKHGHWAISVDRNGENVVTIESNFLSGRDLSAEDEDCIRNAALHLLSFVGQHETGVRRLDGSIDASLHGDVATLRWLAQIVGTGRFREIQRCDGDESVVDPLDAAAKRRVARALNRAAGVIV